jgi:predicted RNase H-like nuclease (RuvC/YqgF family)
MTRELKRSWRWLALIVVGAGIWAAIGPAARGNGPEPIAPMTPITRAEAPPQDVMNLDRRIQALEQRFYPLESAIRRVERQTNSLARPAPTQPALRDPEVERLRNEVELLRARIQELECGLMSVDERTLSPAMKESRRRTGVRANDPCRSNAEAPVQLSIRQ